jgi:tetratricopeptide (TPR) repeat protein/outer membrane biosynthesis protein TonB
MTDMVLGEGRGIEPRAAPGSGDPAIAERTLRSVIEMLEVIDDSDRQLVAALIEQGKLAQQQGKHAAAVSHFGKALAVGERTLGPDDPGLLPALTNLAGAQMLRGLSEEAEPVLARVLTISEAHLGGDHPDLVMLLNDFTRLCLKQSAFSLAEPLLLRLLAIKRSKGEDHPEVATVLGTLALVRHGLGRHESAEQLSRRALDIRERTLAPNHFAVAIALEHLADACAARGKLGEALQLLQRALTVRELTLDTGHSSLRILRERIADLELQAADDSIDHRSGDIVDTALHSYPLLSAEVASSAVMTTPLPAAGPSVVLHKRKAGLGETLLARTEAIVAAAVVALREQYRKIASTAAMLPARAEAIFSPAIAFLRRQYREAATVAGVVILLVVVIATSSPARSGVNQSAVEPPLREPQPPATSVSEAPERRAGLTRRLPVAPSNVVEVSGRDAAESSEIATLRARALQQLSFRRAVNQTNATSGNSDVPTVQAAVLTDNVEPVSAGQRARLIGKLPVPRYPPWLSGVIGEVRVRFDVDTTGWAVMPTFVAVSSTDRVFTDAVRSVIPRMRFLPARAANPPYQALVETVEMAFRFTPPR